MYHIRIWLMVKIGKIIAEDKDQRTNDRRQNVHMKTDH